MCNLYEMSPRDAVERAFRLTLRDDYRPVLVGPFGLGSLLRDRGAGLEECAAQWGLIAPGARTRRPASRAILTNNARLETVDRLPTYRDAWRGGQRCLVAATWYQEPNWETGRNLWWRLRRADGEPWALAGLWSQWTDPQTGEIVPSYTLITRNCDQHPLLKRLHKPDPARPPDAQDKRALLHVGPQDWARWLRGSDDEARSVLAQLPPPDFFDPSDARATDERLAAAAAPSPPGRIGDDGTLSLW